MSSLVKTWLVPIAVIAMSGCTRSLHQADFAPANPVVDWTGVKNLSRDGEVYFGGRPTADAIEAAQEKGIKVVINLLSDREVTVMDFDERAIVERLGIEYVAIPITPKSFGPPDAEILREVLSKTPGPVLIHCKSSNRVGALWAMYLHRHRGVPLDDAIKLGRRAGLRSEKLVETIGKHAN